MHTAMHDSIALQVLGSNRQLAAHLVLGRERDGDAHRVEPAFGHRLQPFGEVEAHTQNRSGEKQGAGLHVRLLVSTFAVLPPPTPGVGFGKGRPRGSLPPELPAGKRGGWHHDSVYPSFRLTSFAPRALNFWASVPAVRSALDFSLDATQTCPRVRRLGGERVAAGIGARGGEVARARQLVGRGTRFGGHCRRSREACT